MTTPARQSIQRLARERALIDPSNVICPECRGSGRDTYGACSWCDGDGYVTAEPGHLVTDATDAEPGFTKLAEAA